MDRLWIGGRADQLICPKGFPLDGACKDFDQIKIPTFAHQDDVAASDAIQLLAAAKLQELAIVFNSFPVQVKVVFVCDSKFCHSLCSPGSHCCNSWMASNPNGCLRAQ